MKTLTVLKGIATGLFVLSVPVIFGTASLRWLVSDTGWYQTGFQKYGISERTRMAPQELGRAAGEISRYLLQQRDDIDIEVTIAGQQQPLFNSRELQHMDDVQKLMGGFYKLGLIAGGYALLYIAFCAATEKDRFWNALGRKLQWGGGITVGLFGLFGILSTFDFEQLFLQFHMVSFSNDTWLLDPTKDNLVMMFPEGFWYDSAIRLASATTGQALSALIVGTALTRRQPTLKHEPSARARR